MGQWVSNEFKSSKTCNTEVTTIPIKLGTQLKLDEDDSYTNFADVDFDHYFISAKFKIQNRSQWEKQMEKYLLARFPYSRCNSRFIYPSQESVPIWKPQYLITLCDIPKGTEFTVYRGLNSWVTFLFLLFMAPNDRQETKQKLSQQQCDKIRANIIHAYEHLYQKYKHEFITKEGFWMGIFTTDLLHDLSDGELKTKIKKFVKQNNKSDLW